MLREIHQKINKLIEGNIISTLSLCMQPQGEIRDKAIQHTRYLQHTLAMK